MLKLDQGRRADGGDDNMVPLINIVFLMLIFFMVAGHIAKSDAIKVDPPASISEQSLVEDEYLEILASADGRVFMGAEPVPLEQLTSELEQRLAGREHLDHLVVRIKADASLEVSELKQLLRQIRAAGLVRVSLITRLQDNPQQLSVAVGQEGGEA